jgi:hypothetical protein
LAGPFFLSCGGSAFCWVFGAEWVQDVVILWSECGRLSGEDGLLIAGFGGVDFMQFFWIYLGVRRFAPSGKTNTGVLRFAQNDEQKQLQKQIPAG